ncbi:MAG: hypothetical protein ABS69_14160 [Nitrosomonadales bacterium SCN 54-20]|nr:MAG: hypothetical protein ABS69_14160 [Nitrosomonadales bacterium SCN 54-20]
MRGLAYAASNAALMANALPAALLAESLSFHWHHDRGCGWGDCSFCALFLTWQYPSDKPFGRSLSKASCFSGSVVHVNQRKLDRAPPFSPVFWQNYDDII